jgi:hypothetical protein
VDKSFALISAILLSMDAMTCGTFSLKPSYVKMGKKEKKI